MDWCAGRPPRLRGMGSASTRGISPDFSPADKCARGAGKIPPASGLPGVSLAGPSVSASLTGCDVPPSFGAGGGWSGSRPRFTQWSLGRRRSWAPPTNPFRHSEVRGDRGGGAQLDPLADRVRGDVHGTAAERARQVFSLGGFRCSTAAENPPLRRGCRACRWAWRWCTNRGRWLRRGQAGSIGSVPRRPDDRCPTRPMSHAATGSPGRATG